MDQLMHTVCLAGKILLESGAETYRVEETMVRLCHAFEAHDAESFVLPTGIFLSVTHENSTRTMVMRIKRRAVNLNRIDQINTLSRQAAEKHLTLDELNRCLHNIENENSESVFVYPAAAMIGFAFVFFFQGNFSDAFTAALCTMLAKWVVTKLDHYGVNYFIYNSVGGAMITLCALIIMSAGMGNDMQIIISASIMILVPGVAITNAVRDSFAGDLVSGMAKGAEAIIIAVSIALGSGAVLGLWMMAGGLLR